MSDIEICEVGPRDGLQSVAQWVPTETKVALIRALLDSGIKVMEVGSFVSPKAIPQMQDIVEVLAQLGPLPKDVKALALVPNAKGARRALDAGVTDLEFVISMTDSHNQSNVRRPTAQSIADLKELLQEVDDKRQLKVRVGLACSFDCPYEGRVPERQVLANAEKILAIRDDIELTIPDTTGMATPDHVGALTRQAMAQFGTKPNWGLHVHDTAGFAIANIYAAFQNGIRIFDASVAGLGGCPFAPGATGNVATEDVVYFFERMGVSTGIDLEKLILAGDIAEALPGAMTGGHARKIQRHRRIASLAGKPYVAQAAE
jgi:hydroxymethylglutaryl-CoA lyase